MVKTMQDDDPPISFANPDFPVGNRDPLYRDGGAKAEEYQDITNMRPGKVVDEAKAELPVLLNNKDRFSG